MRRVRVSTSALLAAALLALVAMPRVAAAQALPSAKELMDRHDAAVGGRAALDKHSSIRRVGSMNIAAMGMQGQVEMMQDKSGRYVQKIQLGPVGDVQQGFDGKTAWVVQPGMGPMIVEGDQAKEMQRQGDFFGSLHDPSNYASAETVELADFEGRKCYKVKLVRKAGGEGYEFFDAATGLTAGVVRDVESPMGKVTSTQVVSDYKDFDGVKMPTKILVKNGQFDVQMSFTDVEFDKVDSNAFALPDAVKALVKP
ncbi:MAG: hypothetical protein HY084_05370 [Gemmatimonadetes bacterium]|nr:hypothetical protein [Gemmatimonadota bacterium]